MNLISFSTILGNKLLVIVVLLVNLASTQRLIKGTSHSASSFVRHPDMCVPIPTDLKLCHGVGYNRMVLPNLLNHESLDEVRQQAASFVPLLAKNCHPHLKEFLCSLFAPVCLPPEMSMLGPIPPCKSLCKSVECTCAPVMKKHNFNWPQMLNCNKFTEKEPCISFDSDIGRNNCSSKDFGSKVVVMISVNYMCALCPFIIHYTIMRDSS